MSQFFNVMIALINPLMFSILLICSKQHLACLRVFEQGLVMETMHYPQEIRHMDLIWDRVALTEAEMSMARQLIDNLARPFEPEKYRDELHEQMALLIESRVAGENFKVEAPIKARKVVDLMEALRASIALTEKEKGQLKEGNDTGADLEQTSAEKPKSTLTPRKRTTRREKGA